MIAIHFFASIREQLECEHKQIKLPEDVATVDDLIAYLARTEGGNWSEVLADSQVMVAVNHEMKPRTAPVTEGDEIAFFPPVTGG